MSIHAVSSAFSYKAPSPTAKLVLLALANYADENSLCYPSIKRLAAETGLGERAVRYAIKALAEAGALVKSERRRANGTRTSDEYTLTMQAASTAASEADKRHLVQDQAASGAGLTTLEPSVEPSVTPQTPIRQLAEMIYRLQPDEHRRSTRPDIATALEAAVKRGCVKADMFTACRAYYAAPNQRREGGAFAKGAHRIIQKDRWRDYLPEPEKPARPVSADLMAHRISHHRDTGEWKPGWGPPPNAITAAVIPLRASP